MSEEDSDELSESTRAALRIQQEIEGKRPAKRSRKSPTSSRKGTAEDSNGTHGAITGIALGEYGHNKKSGSGSTGTVQIKMKGGKAQMSKSNKLFNSCLNTFHAK